MSNLAENETRQTIIPEKEPQQFQAESETGEQAVVKPSDEKLEQATGGAAPNGNHLAVRLLNSMSNGVSSVSRMFSNTKKLVPWSRSK